jgi:putative ABC transport system substrate-binding protein
MQRRDFITLLGGAAAGWPLAARAQQPAARVVGWIVGGTQASNEPGMPAFREALGAHGYVEGRNLIMDYRYTEGQQERLPALAADILRRPVDVMVTVGALIDGNSAIRAVSPTVPIIFYSGVDPVRAGVVPNLNRPGGNISGIFVADLGAKRLGLVHELLPHATTIAVLVNPANFASPTEAAEIRDAAQALGLQVNIANARNEEELYTAFERLAQTRTQALLLTPNPFFNGSARQIAALAARFAIPAFYTNRANAISGGLISYGISVSEIYRVLGDYVGRILKGTKAGDLPVQRPTKFELVINLNTAKALNLNIPSTLLALADEVIE